MNTPINATNLQPPETIGGYTVHPVASLFPLLEGDAYQDLKKAIEQHGQQEPIVLQGNVLIDGRNRLRACLDLGIEPKIREFEEAREADIGRYIISTNIYRRHLHPDRQIAICSLANRLIRAAIAAEAKLKIQKQQGAHGVEGGRGHKKPLNTERCSRVSQRNAREMHSRSTIGQIAALADTSHRKAAQAARVLDHSPELIQQVADGKVTLREATKQLPPPTPRKPKPKTDPPQLPLPNPDKDLAYIIQTLRKIIESYSAIQRMELVQRIITEIKQQWPN